MAFRTRDASLKSHRRADSGFRDERARGISDWFFQGAAALRGKRFTDQGMDFIARIPLRANLSSRVPSRDLSQPQANAAI
jgi:hypothetical protein